MDRQWLYPFYVIAILSLVMLLFGCDEQREASFSVEVQVKDGTGTPIVGATVGVQPCYEIGEEIQCGRNPVNERAHVARGTPVEVTEWEVRADGRNAVVSWTTASETDNAGFDIEKDREGIEGFKKIGFVDGQGTTEASTSYTFRDEGVSREEHTYRLIAVANDGTSNVVGDPETVRVRTSIDPTIRPLTPNPVQRRAVYGAAVDDTSVIKATVHTLDGATVQTLVHETIQPGIHRRAWNVGDLAGGIYEHRTQIQTDGDVVARDTTYAIVAGRRSVGTTAGDGTVSTTDRTRFPPLYDVPPIEIRDPEGIVLDTLRVASTVEFVVTVDDERRTFQRTVSEGENTLTLPVGS